jgi:hypothetical protein
METKEVEAWFKVTPVGSNEAKAYSLSQLLSTQPIMEPSQHTYTHTGSN